MLEEKAYRTLVAETFERIMNAFDAIDPDVAECEDISGALTITLLCRSKLVVSPQPSVQQIWLAVASEAKGYHFSYQENSKRWVDDRTGEGELFSELQKAIKNATQESVSFGSTV